MSPYSFSVVRYVPNPSFTSSPFSTRQCFSASSVSAAFFFARFVGHRGDIRRADRCHAIPTCQVLAVEQGHETSGRFIQFLVLPRALTAWVNATIRIDAKMDVRKVVLLKQGE